MQLTISQAAALLGTSEAMLTRWARQGAIPAQESENIFYFERDDLETWAARRHITLREPDVLPLPAVEKRASLVDAMSAGGFYYDIPGEDATALLSNLILKLELPQVDRTALLARVLEREALSSTGIGNGIAIPHPRQPLEGLSSSAIVTCFPAAPVSFQAVDSEGVTVVFLMLSVDTPSHLKLLSQLSYVLHQPGNATFIRSAPSAEKVLGMVESQSLQLLD